MPRLGGRATTLWRPEGIVRASVLNNLTAYWNMEELSGNAVDSIAGLTLTNNNGATSTTGRRGNARRLTRASSQFFSLADEPVMSTGDISFGFAVWVRARTYSNAFQYILSKGDDGGSAGAEYELFFSSGAGSFRFGVGAGVGVGSAVVSAVLGRVLSPEEWYFLVGWHDADLNTISLQINNGRVVTAACPLGGHDNATPFRLGPPAASTHFWDGDIDEVLFLKGRIPTREERTFLWNKGFGRTYPLY